MEAEIAPLIAQHSDDMEYMNPQLFRRIDAVFQALPESLGRIEVKGQVTAAQLDAETVALVQRYHDLFLRHGAGLAEEAQARIREINAELSQLSSEFGDNLLTDTQLRAVHITEESELAGVADAQKSFFAETARAAGKTGWLVPLGLPTAQPILEQLSDPAVRARVYEASLQRGGRRSEQIAHRMAVLRAEKATLFGYHTFAEFVISDETAGTPEAALELLSDFSLRQQSETRRVNGKTSWRWRKRLGILALPLQTGRTTQRKYEPPTMPSIAPCLNPIFACRVWWRRASFGLRKRFMGYAL